MAREAPSRSTLIEVPQRALKFLQGVGNSPSIRQQLAAVGYTEAEHAMGWALLQKVSGYTVDRPALGIGVDADVNDTTHALDAWDEPNFARIHATLERSFPEQADFVFQDLQPARGPGAVLTVATLIKRMEALESAPERKATRKQDHAALELLASRGYTKDEWKRLKGLVLTAQRGTPAEAAAGPEPSPTPLAQDKEAALIELYFWLKEWSTTAKSVLKRHDERIHVGVATRKPPVRKKGGGKASGGGGGGSNPPGGGSSGTGSGSSGTGSG